MITRQYFYEKASSRKEIPAKDCDMPPSKVSSQTVRDTSTDDSRQEYERMKQEVERLLSENSKLRKDIRRLKGETDDASETGL